MIPITAALAASVVLLLANGFFVASEFALVKMRPTRLATLAERGDRRARAALGISRRLDAYLSANQLGITLASLGLGWLGEPALARVLAPMLEGLGAWSGIATHTLATAAGLSLLTLLHVVIGELVPKSLALQLTEPVALWTAAPLRVFYVVAFPVIWSFNFVSQRVLRLLRLRAASEAERLHSPEELRLVVRNVTLDPRARGLIDRVFDYTHRVAHQIMTLRRDVTVLRADRSFDENLEVVLKNQFTRYPLVDPDDRVLGYVHLKDLSAALATGRRSVEMRELAREPVYVSRDSGLEDLRRELQGRNVHLAVVRDAAKRFVGIVTLEDLLEELVGEIRDEQDASERPPIVRRERGGFEADGRITLDVAERELGLRVAHVPPTVETLGDLMVQQLGAPPLPGASVEVGSFRLTVVEVRDQRVWRLRGEGGPDRRRTPRD